MIAGSVRMPGKKTLSADRLFSARSQARVGFVAMRADQRKLALGKLPKGEFSNLKTFSSAVMYN